MVDCVLNIAAPNPLLTARENLKPSHTILRLRYVHVHSQAEMSIGFRFLRVYSEKQSKDRNNSRRSSKVKRSVQLCNRKIVVYGAALLVSVVAVTCLK